MLLWHIGPVARGLIHALIASIGPRDPEDGVLRWKSCAAIEIRDAVQYKRMSYRGSLAYVTAFGRVQLARMLARRAVNPLSKPLCGLNRSAMQVP